MPTETSDKLCGKCLSAFLKLVTDNGGTAFAYLCENCGEKGFLSRSKTEVRVMTKEVIIAA
ncbi:MAG: hypothetical protein ABSF09_07945 [Candidatus Bathyarchaeia archaeon]|jgi:hypothetical protein